MEVIQQSTKPKALIIYHRVDYDGVFSGIIAKRVIEDKTEAVMLGLDYSDDAEKRLFSKSLEGFENIIMVDISLKPEDMVRLFTICQEKEINFIWIDHHITAIEDSQKYGYNTLPGLRRVGTAAVELTWEYFVDSPSPLFIKLLGAYDVWNKIRFDWEGVVLPLQVGLKAEYGLNFPTLYQDFEELLNEDNLWKIVEGGRLVRKFQKTEWASAARNSSFPVNLKIRDKSFKGQGILSHVFSSNIFQSLLEKEDCDLDFVCVLNQTNSKLDEFGRPMYKISMYSEGEREELSCGDVCRALYNGGGHENAAGGFMTQEQFVEFINNKEITCL